MIYTFSPTNTSSNILITWVHGKHHIFAMDGKKEIQVQMETPRERGGVDKCEAKVYIRKYIKELTMTELAKKTLIRP